MKSSQAYNYTLMSKIDLDRSKIYREKDAATARSRIVRTNISLRAVNPKGEEEI